MSRVLARASFATLLVLAVVASVVGAVGGSATPAAAADTSQFYPGNIISDDVFYAGTSMTAAQVQAFLDVRGAGCAAGSDGTPCLRNFRADTPSRDGDARCGPYAGAPNESAADIIAKIGVACSINPRVLLVMLQKEQSLVSNTGSSLYATRYQKAMGFGCPDTAACDTRYYGFFNQVYNAARQFQNYRAAPSSYGYRAGLTNTVRFNPNVNCGSSAVYIQNTATAALYNYTPYQPNAAALAANYGSGDSCSAYGNRNFWLYYTDWFGTTQSVGGGAVANLYAVLGGQNGSLGAMTSSIGCGLRDGGCYQDYVNGAIHWSSATGAHVTRGWIADRWRGQLRENGDLGYPVGDEIPAANGGVSQRFQGGYVYSSPATGARIVRGWVYDRWTALGRDLGLLGLPQTDEFSVVGGVGQTYQGGVIYSSPSTGAHEVHGWILDKWSAMGRESGPLGFPTSDEQAAPGGVYNTFSGGVLFSAPATGAHEMHGWILQRWNALGGPNAAVGYPIADEAPTADGSGAVSQMSNGLIISSPATGAHELRGQLASKWTALGGSQSVLGYPISDQQALSGGGQVAQFQGGSIYWSAATGAFEVHGWVRDKWTSMGGRTGEMGYPTSDEQPAPDGVGVYQTFQNGAVYSSPRTGAKEVHGLIAGKWRALGGMTFPGAPLADEAGLPDGTGRISEFSSGAAIYWSPATGAYEVHGWIRELHRSFGSEGGLLGYPTSDEQPVTGVPGAVQSTFQNGVVYSSPSTRAHEVHGSVLARYLQLGGPASSLGLPVSNEYSVPDGRRSDFQFGSITCNLTTGAITVSP